LGLGCRGVRLLRLLEGNSMSVLAERRFSFPCTMDLLFEKAVEKKAAALECWLYYTTA